MYKLTREEYFLANKIADRAMELAFYDEFSEPKVTALLDIENAIKHWDIRLNNLLAARDEDFCHDIYGIMTRIVRSYPVKWEDPLWLPRTANGLRKEVNE